MPEQRFSGHRLGSCSHVVVRTCGVCQSVGRGQFVGAMSTKQRQGITRTILEMSGTLIDNDHFVYASGDHVSGWVAKNLINLRSELAHQLVLRMRRLFNQAVIQWVLQRM